jgi:1,4-alpha-glucan branching enzyme
MSLKKKYRNYSSTCQVTFTMPKEAVQSAQTVHLAGDFNNWDTTATPLKKQKSGDFSVTLDLQTGQEYQYRYLLDGKTWVNDWKADRYQPSPIGNWENSVVAL